MITARSWGIAGSVVDSGRPGQMWLGKGRGGAVDVESLMLANRLVGNAAAAPAYETSGGLTLEFGESAAIAITGAVADVAVTNGPPVGWGSVVALPAEGERCVSIGWPLGEDGRKLYAGTALFSETGELLAHACQTWIVPRS